jgi:hypothetical protein
VIFVGGILLGASVFGVLGFWIGYRIGRSEGLKRAAFEDAFKKGTAK